MANRKLFTTIFFLSLLSFSETEKQFKKFEDLFIWKISDELKLTPQEEAVVSEIIKSSNKKKTDSNIEIDSLNERLKAETTDAARKIVYAKLRSAHKVQLNITLEELEKLNKSIGLKKLGLYLEIKKDLADKIKSIWNQKEKKEGSLLPPPKIIEEK